MGSQYLLSGLLRCGVCGKSYSAQGAKSGQFAYYVCSSLFREGAGACTARYLNATKVEDLVIGKVRERILTEETITELVTLVAEEIDNLAGEVNGRLTAITAELSDVETRLENLYQALETQQLPVEVLSPRILSLKSRQDQLVAAREEAEFQLEQRRAELPTSREIKGYVAEFRAVPPGRDVPGAEGPDSQLRAGHRDSGRRGGPDVYHPHAPGRGDVGNRPRFLISSSPAHHDVDGRQYRGVQSQTSSSDPSRYPAILRAWGLSSAPRRFPGLTTISLTKDRMKARVSVSSLSIRKSLISRT